MWEIKHFRNTSKQEKLLITNAGTLKKILSQISALWISARSFLICRNFKEPNHRRVEKKSYPCIHKWNSKQLNTSKLSNPISSPWMERNSHSISKFEPNCHKLHSGEPQGLLSVKKTVSYWLGKKKKKYMKHTSSKLHFTLLACRHLWPNFTVSSWHSVAFHWHKINLLEEIYSAWVKKKIIYREQGFKRAKSILTPAQPISSQVEKNTRVQYIHMSKWPKQAALSAQAERQELPRALVLAA